MNLSREDTFIATCPGCGKRYRLANKYLGKQVRCKHCKQVWIAQAASEQSAYGDTTDLPSTNQTGLSQTSGKTTVGASRSADASSDNGTSNIDVEKFWIGKKLGRFEVLEVLGKGAMGVVFRAHDPDLRRDVALKILEKQFIKSQKRTYRLEQFIREARSAARLSHPNSVTVYEIGQDKGWYFIAMEIVSGGTLLDLIRRKKKRVPIELVCELIAQAADALSAAHKLGIIHRDIKPSNLMLTSDGRIKVADFGLAQIQDTSDDFELPTKAVGTPYWMSPEQCKGQTAIPQSDIYSLGAVLYFALTGEVPFKGNTKKEILTQHINAPVPDPRKIRKDVSETLYNIIKKAMAKNPSERFHDAAEMAIALRNIANALRQSKMAEKWWTKLASTGTVATQSSDNKKQSSPVIKFLLILIPLILIIAMIIYFASKSEKPAKPAAPVKPAPTQIKPAEIKVPVYVIKGQRTYHAKGCPLLKGVPANMLIKFDSDKDAEKAGNIACRYCQDLLKKQKAQARKKAHQKTKKGKKK